ncbi:MAG: YicC/YloC family endoribonuclease [Pseudomonadota bacterium]|nr:YicC/YloC family endoribonuclease [Pseudomonadota bacterium]
MIRSMTSFAGSEMEIDGFVYGWEVRSVNHRYLDVSVRIPENLRVLEAEFRALVSQKLTRGKVECSLSCQRQAGTRAQVSIDRKRVQGLIRIMQEIQAEMEEAAPVSTAEVMKFPGVLIEEKQDPGSLKGPVIAILEKTLEELVQFREREGNRLSQVIAERCHGLHGQIGRVRTRLPEVAKALRRRLAEKVGELEAELDNARFEQEVVFMLHKMDVDEEMDRLETHIIEVERVLANEDIAGRRLDFLLQEMNREANTLGSKSTDKETTQASVEMKVLIEQMREQVQNIE